MSQYEMDVVGPASCACQCQCVCCVGRVCVPNNTGNRSCGCTWALGHKEQTQSPSHEKRLSSTPCSPLVVTAPTPSGPSPPPSPRFFFTPFSLNPPPFPLPFVGACFASAFFLGWLRLVHLLHFLAGAAAAAAATLVLSEGSS